MEARDLWGIYENEFQGDVSYLDCLQTHSVVINEFKG